MSKIGVFDSGIGGLSVAQAIEKALPDDTVQYVSDSKHMPYGDKTPEQKRLIAKVGYLTIAMRPGEEVPADQQVLFSGINRRYRRWWSTAAPTGFCGLPTSLTSTRAPSLSRK